VRFGDLEQRTAFLQFSRQITRRWFAQLRFEYSQKELFDDLVRVAGANEDDERGPINYEISTVGLSMAYDARTDRHGTPTPIGATDGYKLSGYAELATELLLGSEEFVKFGAAFVDPTSFRKGRGVFTYGVRYDHGYPIDGTVLPETERFFAGGDLTLRGYEEGRAFTEVIRSPLPGGGEVLTVEEAGGNVRFLGNLDLELRVCNCVGGLPLASAVFFDFGVVSNSLDALRDDANWKPFLLDEMRYSVGVALARIITPVVSLSLEYAIPINPGVGDDQTGRVHVNFGFVVN
jgi:outer membrane protein assembly factor BamA